RMTHMYGPAVRRKSSRLEFETQAVLRAASYGGGRRCGKELAGVPAHFRSSRGISILQHVPSDGNFRSMVPPSSWGARSRMRLKPQPDWTDAAIGRLSYRAHEAARDPGKRYALCFDGTGKNWK